MQQLEKISEVYNEFPTKIKIIKPCGETNWLDINNHELELIIRILLKEKKG